MVSDFRKKKLVHVFKTFFDNDGSGTIEKKDFELAIERIAKSRGWAPGNSNYTFLNDTLMKVWEGILAGDANGDGQVTEDEWISMWEVYSKNPSDAAEWQKLYCKFVFTLEDASNDGSINSGEFATVMETFGLKKDEATAAFQKMAKGKAEVTWDDFQKLWTEFFSTEDVNAPGNYIFGKSFA